MKRKKRHADVKMVLNGSGYKEDKIGDVEYYVIPTTLLVEGVHSGNKGGLFYSRKELKKWVRSWDNKPVVLDHPPKKNGKQLMAGNKEVLAKTKVGILLNTACADKDLTSESWIEKKLIRKHSPEIEKKILNKEQIEVSTGLDVGILNSSGVHNNQQYKFRATDFRPDHLAIILKGTGACSCAKGCGMNVLNCECSGTVEVPDWFTKPDNHVLNKSGEISFDEITYQLALALKEKMGKPGVSWYGHPVSVYADKVIFSDNGTGYWLIGYKVSGKTVKLDSGPPESVVRRVSYETVDGSGYVTNSAGELFIPSPDSTKGNAVDETAKKKMVESIIILNSTYLEEDREALMGLDEVQLNLCHKVATRNAKKAEDDKKKSEKKKVVLNKDETPEDEKDWMSKIPKSVLRDMKDAKRITDAKRDEFISTILNMEETPYEEDELRSIEDLGQLEKLAKMAEVASKKTKAVMNEHGPDEDEDEDEDDTELVQNRERPAKRVGGGERKLTGPNSATFVPKSGHLVLPDPYDDKK